MNYKTIKLIIVLLLMIFFVSCISNQVFALTPDEISKMQEEISELQDKLNKTTDTKTKNDLQQSINAKEAQLKNAGVATSWNVTNFTGFDSEDYSGQQITSKTQNIMGTIINTIRIVGTGMAIIMLTYVGINYMTAAPSEKAEFKKSATAFIVGAVVLFAGTNILGVIANFASSNI